MIQIRQCMSELLTARSGGTYHGDRATTRHGEVFHRQSFDILGAQRDSRITPAEADVRVMAFCFGKLADFLNKVERASRKLWNRTVDAVGRPPLAIDSLLVRPEARLPYLPD
jgi:hypothetical protein